ncbi:hypothetical protein JNUCC1_03070 [Lentibacillus sp. JNUCC-1]|uniref:hypothetical protein n=1 Tax=Lentibacillus sp. JNUCC-1 TaxID=2654513 RepID=UPI0012E8E259|nr:hypothetical protein [Lentibacillus sp. JNUCC-1]MUV39197.1 hypothetical protein [Lentibacillus sp. JNUCC-1]
MNVDALAKKHKKMFEQYSFNAGGCKVNGDEFYLVNYKRWHKLTGCAVVSPQQPSEQKSYMEAFYLLNNYAQYASLLLIHGEFRANINMTSFERVNAFIDTISSMNKEVSQKDEEIIMNCKAATESILRLQQELVDQYTPFQEKNEHIFNGNKPFITKDDVKEALELIAEVEYIQYQQLLLQYRTIDDFKKLYKICKTDDEMRRYMNAEVKTYINEFISSKENLKKNIKNVTYQKDMDQLDREQFKELIKAETVKNVEKVNAESLKGLRFP